MNDLKLEVARLNDKIQKIVIIGGIFILILFGVVVFTARAALIVKSTAKDSQDISVSNGQQGLGNRQLLCIATNAPGNEITVPIPAKLCDRDFSQAK